MHHWVENYRQFGATLVAQATPAQPNWYYPLLRPPLKSLGPGYRGADWRVEKALFPGFLAAVLAAAGAAGLWRRHRRRPRPRLDPGRRAGLAALTGGAVAVFLAADLLTLGWWPPRWVASLGGLDGGYTALGVAFAALVAARLALGRRWTGATPLALPTAPAWERGLVFAGLASWLLAFPLVFETLTEVVPGFGAMRTPTRTWPIVSFAVAWLAGRGLDGLLRRLRGRSGRTALAAAACLWVPVESMPRPLAWNRVPEPPPVHRWIAATPEVRAVLVLPLRRNEREVPAMWSSTAHWKPIVNGFSAFTPRAYRDLREVCCWPAPDEAALERLRRMGVTHVVVDAVAGRRPWQRRELAAWRERVAAGELPGVRRVYRDARGDEVYAIATAAAPPRGRSSSVAPRAEAPGPASQRQQRSPGEQQDHQHGPEP